MTETAQRLQSSLSQLSREDRAELAYFLLTSLDPETDDDAEAAWDAELQRRAEEIASGEAVGEPADQVFAELREKFK
jgi:putative addiction module component (TIGR02574 family)